MSNNYNWEEAARRYQEEYIDRKNRCERCNRPLSDPMADYGWRCAEILGVEQNDNLLQEHFFAHWINTNNNNGYALDNLAQQVYNKHEKTYISEKPKATKRPLTQVGNFDLKNASLYWTPYNPFNKKLYDTTDSLIDDYQKKVKATCLPQPLGKDKDGEFVYEEYDPRIYLPSIKTAATIAQDIYGADMEKDNRAPKDIVLDKKWKVMDIVEGRQGMKMGIYIKKDDDELNPSEYIIVFKGSSNIFEKPMDWVNNAERHFSSKSADMWDAINCAQGFSDYAGDTKITFVGHSKGGAEAAAAAVATNRNAILFNPANTNLKDYGLDSNDYTGIMVQYVVENEILSRTGIGPVSPTRIPTIRTVFIEQQEHMYTVLDESIENHQMTAVMRGLD